MTMQPKSSAIAPPDASPRCRVQVRRKADSTKYVDGGWWPRSKNLSVELPALCTALSDPLGPIALVGYRATAWEVAPPLLELQDHVVRLESLESKDAATLVLVGENGKSLTLLIVPPNTESVAAGQALADASRAGSPDVAARAEAHTLAELATRLAGHEHSGDERRAIAIRQWVDEAAAQFQSAPVQAYVPILVEHIVRGRMHATSQKPS